MIPDVACHPTSRLRGDVGLHAGGQRHEKDFHPSGIITLLNALARVFKHGLEVARRQSPGRATEAIGAAAVNVSAHPPFGD